MAGGWNSGYNGKLHRKKNRGTGRYAPAFQSALGTGEGKRGRNEPEKRSGEKREEARMMITAMESSAVRREERRTPAVSDVTQVHGISLFVSRSFPEQ